MKFWCKMARSQRKVLVGKKLPPTKDSLSLQLLRTFYQLMIWTQAKISFQHLSDAVSYGYDMDVNNKLQPKLMN